MTRVQKIAERDNALEIARSALTDEPLYPTDKAIVAALLALYLQRELEYTG